MIASSQKTVWELPSFAAVPTHADPTTYMICISTRSTSPSSLRSPALLASTSATRSTAGGLGKRHKPRDELHALEGSGPARGGVVLRHGAEFRHTATIQANLVNVGDVGFHALKH